ncbi:MAG: hypothetical protein AB7E15_09710 [Azospira sp.]
MALTKPPVLPAWAEAGEKVQPSNAEIQAGWPLSNVPPARQRWNWILNFLANGVRYLTRRGLPDYGADETYMIGDRIVGDDGKTYRSLQDDNTGNTPSTSPLWWERWGFSKSELTAELNNHDYKDSCRVATTANLGALSGLLTIDGVVLIAGDRVLVKDQGAGSQNGIYVAAAGAWSRAADFDENSEVTSGALVPVAEGTAGADTVWMLTTDGVITVGVTSLAFGAVNGNVGTPGTYNQVTVDAKGRVIAGVSTSGLPSGTPLMWPVPTAPSWALVRDGSAISRASYASLFSALCPTRNGTTANGSAAITGLSSTTDLYVGMPVEGTGIPAGATIASIASATAITISANATASATVPIRLFYYGYGSSGSAATFGVPDDLGLFERGLDNGARGYEATVLSGTTTNGSAAITGLSTTRGLFIGMAVAGTGVPGGATVASITSGTAITLSANATASGTVPITFTGGQIGNERADDFKSHTHSGPTLVVNGSGVSGSYGYLTNTGSTNPTGGAETRPRFRSLLPIIVY